MRQSFTAPLSQNGLIILPVMGYNKCRGQMQYWCAKELSDASIEKIEWMWEAGR